MKRSSEIEELLREVVAALERADIAVIERAMSRDLGVTVIGSDPGEYSRDYQQIVSLFRESTPESPMHIHLRLHEIRGYEHEDVGWADGSGAFERDGESVAVRLTAVVVREGDQWRMVQNHASIGVPNDHMFDPLFQRTRARTHASP